MFTLILFNLILEEHKLIEITLEQPILNHSELLELCFCLQLCHLCRDLTIILQYLMIPKCQETVQVSFPITSRDT